MVFLVLPNCCRQDSTVWSAEGTYTWKGGINRIFKLQRNRVSRLPEGVFNGTSLNRKLTNWSLTRCVSQGQVQKYFYSHVMFDMCARDSRRDYVTIATVNNIFVYPHLTHTLLVCYCVVTNLLLMVLTSTRIKCSI